ncbi:MAG: hypothetical protein ACRDF4_08420 [Rhabdochlamydiaceae bacterium]
MRIRTLVKKCPDGPCPAVFEAETGEIFVQGPNIHDGEALKHAGPGEDEGLVAIPREMIWEASRLLKT